MKTYLKIRLPTDDFKKNRRMFPIIPTEIISPRPTLATMNGIRSLLPYAKRNTHGTMTAFEIIGGRHTRYGHLRSLYERIAPMRVASVPNIISIQCAPRMMFDIRHPTVTPGTAERVKNGKTVSASDMRNWTTPKDIGAKIIVIAVYSAAISPLCARNFVSTFFIILSILSYDLNLETTVL